MGTYVVDRNSDDSGGREGPRCLFEEYMDRLKLGLFGAARQVDVRTKATDTDTHAALRRERLSGLTPIEIAAVEAMPRGDAASLSAG